jgi:hypothetical protein
VSETQPAKGEDSNDYKTKSPETNTQTARPGDHRQHCLRWGHAPRDKQHPKDRTRRAKRVCKASRAGRHDPGYPRRAREAPKGSLSGYPAFQQEQRPGLANECDAEAINKAVAVHPVTIWKEAKNGIEDFDVKGLADLFIITQLHKPAGLSDQEKVAQSLTELLHNPQMPARLYEAVAEFVANGISKDNETIHAAPFLSGLIAKLDDPIGHHERGQEGS